MITSRAALKHLRFLPFALMIFIGSACSISPTSPADKPAIDTLQVTELVTIPITQEVTRMVEIPVTVTPEFTTTSDPAVNSSTNNNSGPTPTSAKGQVIILKHSDCMYGPGSVYLYKYSVSSDSPMEAIGRNLEGSWVYIQAIAGWNPCWLQSSLVKFTDGDISGVPIVHSRLPYSNQYMPPGAIARRTGTEVTISWKAVWMSLDDYRGYLIEAWLCQGGKQVFDPISYVPPLAGNTGTLSIRITDDPGCTFPSSVRIYSAVKQGYSIPYNIPWPAY
jgi:hypothetical protein